MDFVIRLHERGALSGEGYITPFLHRIGGADKLKAFGADTKTDTSWQFLTNLRDVGRSAAKAWLAANYDSVGVRATLDLRANFNPPS